MVLQESGEMYLETIYVLSLKSPQVRSIDVCEHMGFSKPSVSRAVSLLKNSGYLTVNQDGHLALTESGRYVAVKMYERHRLLSSAGGVAMPADAALLMELGVSEKTAVEDACRMEHVLSDESFAAMKRHVMEEHAICVDV